MQNKILGLFFLFLAYSTCSFSQTHERDPQLRAQDIVDQICDRMLIPSEKKDSLIITFRSFYDDMHTYKNKGEHMFHALEIARDTDVRKILTNDDQYLIYQKYMKELAIEREKLKNKKGGHVKGHH